MSKQRCDQFCSKYRSHIFDNNSLAPNIRRDDKIDLRVGKTARLLFAYTVPLIDSHHIIQNEEISLDVHASRVGLATGHKRLMGGDEKDATDNGNVKRTVRIGPYNTGDAR